MEILRKTMFKALQKLNDHTSLHRVELSFNALVMQGGHYVNSYGFFNYQYHE